MSIQDVRKSQTSPAPLSAAEQPGQPEPLPSIGTVIRCLRVHRGMSLRELARKSEIGLGLLGVIERDKVTPAFGEIAQLADAVGFSAPALQMLADRPRAAASLLTILSIVRATQARMADGQDRLGELVAEGATMSGGGRAGKTTGKQLAALRAVARFKRSRRRWPSPTEALSLVSGRSAWSVLARCSRAGYLTAVIESGERPRLELTEDGLEAIARTATEAR